MIIMYFVVGFPVGMSSSLLMGQHVISVGLLIDFISEKKHTLLLGVGLVKRQHADTPLACKSKLTIH